MKGRIIDVEAKIMDDSPCNCAVTKHHVSYTFFPYRDLHKDSRIILVNYRNYLRMIVNLNSN